MSNSGPINSEFGMYEKRRKRIFQWFFWGVTLLIIYGSLYPFQFVIWSLSANDWAELLVSWRNKTSWSDLLSNIMLFVPYSLFGYLAFNRGARWWRGWSALVISGLLLAIFLQVAQLWIPGRTPELQDAIWNFVGIVLGLILAVLGSSRIKIFAEIEDTDKKIAILLILNWLILFALPLVPSLSWSEIKESIKPLMFFPSFQPHRVIFYGVSWLFISHLVERIGLSVRYFAFIVIFTFTAQLLVVGNSLSASQVLGLLLALVLLQISPKVRRMDWMIIFMVLSLFANGLEDYTLHPKADFQWVPFSGSLTGNMLLNLKVILEKFFYLGALAYCLTFVAISQSSRIIIAGGLTGMVEVLQMWTGNHTPEITDPLLAVVLVIGMAALLPDRQRTWYVSR
ncbi:MAG: VanZ family protein [Gammaproteobacteria bacterium]|nr:VanZ family protein [Gammaproteobacteria bacterium]